MSESIPRISTNDPLIDEIRQYRVELDRRFGGDWEAYGAFIREAGEKIRKEHALKAADASAKEGVGNGSR